MPLFLQETCSCVRDFCIITRRLATSQILQGSVSKILCSLTPFGYTWCPIEFNQNYKFISLDLIIQVLYLQATQSADKSLARPGRTQTGKHVRDARNFNTIETRAVIKFFFWQGKAPKEIHDILTETLVCFLPDQAKDLSAPLHFLQVDTKINE